MPCVIDDCDIPLFLRDKLHADFRNSPDEAFDLLDRSLARVSNPQQGRIENPEFHVDWSVDWKTLDGNFYITWTFVDHGPRYPYIILSQCTFHCNEAAAQQFKRAEAAGEHWAQLSEVMGLLVKRNGKEGLTVLIKDAFEGMKSGALAGKDGALYRILITYRRMGEDTGMDTIVHLGNNFERAVNWIKDVKKRASKRPTSNPKNAATGVHKPAGKSTGRKR